MAGLWNRVASDDALVLMANGLLQITVLAAVALIAAQFFRRNASVRHCILLSAVLSVAIVPVLTVALQRTGFSVVAIPVALSSTDSVTPVAAPKTGDLPVASLPYHEEEGVEATTQAPIDEYVPPLPSDYSSATQVSGVPNRSNLHSAVGGLTLVWLSGALVSLIGIVRGDWRLRRLVGCARPLNLGENRRVLDEVCRILRVKSLPRIVHSSDVAGPIVVGVVRPLIILPTRLVDTLSARELRHILLHETAHAVRRDQLAGLLQRILGAILWPHPLVYLLNRELACAREDVCDNYVLAAVAPVDYGETLLRLGQLMPLPKLMTGSVGMFNTHSKLEDRIADLLDKRRNGMIRLRPTSIAVIVLSAFVVSLAIAGSRIASADPPLGQSDRLEAPPVLVDSVSRTVARTLEFAQLRDQRAKRAAKGRSSAVAKETSDHQAAEGESFKDVSKAVDRTVKSLRKRGAQDAGDTERLGLYAIDVITGEVILVRDKPIGDLTYFGSPSWSNDGRRILFDASPGKSFGKTHLKLFYVDKRKAGINDLGLGNCPTLSPDGERVAFLLNPGVIPDAPRGIWEMNSDGSKRRHLGSYGVPKWSPDGRQLLIISFSSPCRMSIMDVELARERPVQLEGHRFYSNPGWAGDNQTLVAIVAWDGGAGIAMVDVTDPEQARVKEILWKKGDRIDMSPLYPVYSPKTDLCVFVGGSEDGEALYSVKPGQLELPKRLEPSGHDGKIARLAFSPDGRYVLFCSDRHKRSLPARE